MATLAVFIALGGSAYATLRVGSSEIRDNSVRSRDLRNNDVRGKDLRNRTLTGRDVRGNTLGGGVVKESSLRKVPAAGAADTLGGLSAAQLKVTCPAGTTASQSVCVESAASAPTTRGGAGRECRNRGRSLSGYETLLEFFSGGGIPAAGGEWTADVFESRATAGQLDTVVITTVTGDAEFQNAVSPAVRAYRCVAVPAN